jgi:hypothetical protein
MSLRQADMSLEKNKKSQKKLKEISMERAEGLKKKR